MSEGAAAEGPGLPPFLLTIIGHLRRRHVQVGVDDLRDLRLALGAGFGLASTASLRDLCVALWASSPVEAAIVRSAFASVEDVPEWTTGPSGESAAADLPDPAQDPATGAGRDGEAGQGDGAALTGAPRAEGSGSLPPPSGITDPALVLVPQYPLTAREVAQAWRHLRRPVRSGPATELDVAATIRERARRGVATPPVVVPRRRNTMRLLLLLDRNGSMGPYHGYVDYVVAAIREAGRIDEVSAVYFHDVPADPESRPRAARVLAEDPFRMDIDPMLAMIEPMRSGRVYADARLTRPVPLADVLAQVTAATGVLVISDGGAARRTFDAFRLVDTVAMLKAAAAGASGAAWLNPAPTARWPGTTAAMTARHVAMYPFTRRGLDQAVDSLRGRPALLARPL
jgi:uncharacterized protein with von Willebrand factor type A (vWA) domain